MKTAHYQSPLGVVEITENEGYITSMHFTDAQNKSADSSSPVLESCMAQLTEYFDGKRQYFDFPFKQTGTDFQQRVCDALLEVPYGATATYGAIAKRIGRPQASRAVGAACGKNRLWIAVPCHRVIGANGAMTGYAGRIDRKEWLLKHEGAMENVEKNCGRSKSV